MAAISSTTIHDSAYLCATHTIHVKAEGPISSLPFPRPNFCPNQKNFISPRLRICYKRKTAVEQCLRVPVTFCLMGSNSEACPETDQTYVPNDAEKIYSGDIVGKTNWGMLLNYKVKKLLLQDCFSYGEHSRFKNEIEAAIDLKLPRRSLLVTFTCNSCDTRSQKLINRLAYERGLVYVQCSGCSKYHKLVDNLGLVVEYNFQEETDQI